MCENSTKSAIPPTCVMTFMNFTKTSTITTTMKYVDHLSGNISNTMI